MPIDSSIPLGIRPLQLESPVNQLASILQIQQAQQANQLNGMKMDEYARGVDQQNRLRALLSGAGDNPDEVGKQLLRGGFLKEANDYVKGQRDNAKLLADTEETRMKAAAKRVDIAGQAFGYVRQNPTLENAHAAIDYLHSNGVISPEQAMQYKNQVASDPSKIPQLADVGFRAALNAKDQLVQFATRNTGGTTDTLAQDPVSGTSKVVGSVKNTQSPDNAASVAATMRGQNMVDARSREANDAAREASQSVYDTERGVVVNKATGLARPAATLDGKPVGEKEKPLTDTQSKAAGFGARMKHANQIMSDLEDSGTTKAIPGARAGYGVGGVITALSPASQQNLTQAQRDFVNAVLRRESGAAISESEFDNAIKQYFPQVGDKPEQVAQKKRNREISMRGVLAEVPEKQRGKVVDEIIGDPAQSDLHKNAQKIINGGR